MIAKNHKTGTPAKPLCGLFACDAAEVARNTPKTGKALVKLGDVVEFETDSALREYENVPLDPSCRVIALSRTLSPAVIAEYRTQLPDKKLLQAKLREFYALNVGDREQP